MFTVTALPSIATWHQLVLVPMFVCAVAYPRQDKARQGDKAFLQLKLTMLP